MVRLKTREVVNILVELTEKSFSKRTKGKARIGHYRIGRLDFLHLIGRKTLDDPSYYAMQSRIHEKGWFFLDLGDHFAVSEADRMNGYRKVPKWILEEYRPEEKKTMRTRNRENKRKKINRRGKEAE